MTDSLKCPKCIGGYAGLDYTGEAIDCHYCDGTGLITAKMFTDLSDRFQEAVGDLMMAETLLEELGFGKKLEFTIKMPNGDSFPVFTRTRVTDDDLLQYADENPIPQVWFDEDPIQPPIDGE